MIKDHSKTTSQLEAAAMKAKIDVPDKMDSAHRKMFDSLKDMKDDDFAKEYHRRSGRRP